MLLNALVMQRVNSRLVTEDLNLIQKPRRIESAKLMLDNIAEMASLIKRIITENEAWVYEHDIETVQQFIGCNFTRPL